MDAYVMLMTGVYSKGTHFFTPLKPPSDSKSLQKFMIWKLTKIDSEVTSYKKNLEKLLK